MSKRNLIIAVIAVLAAAVLISTLRSKPELVAYEAAPEAEIASRARIEHLLDKHLELHFRDTRLADAAKQIADKSGIPIRIDIKALEDASIGAETPVTLDASGMSLRAAIDRLLNSLDLTWVVKNETLMVTTPEKAGNELMVVVYPVHDLVMVQTSAGVQFNYQNLKDEITAAAAQTTWDEVGGPGSIHELASAGALVVSQTREVQAQVALLLAALRKARDAQGMPRADGNKAVSQWRQPRGSTNVPAPAPARPQPGTNGQSLPTAPATSVTPPGVTPPGVTPPGVTASGVTASGVTAPK